MQRYILLHEQIEILTIHLPLFKHFGELVTIFDRLDTLGHLSLSKRLDTLSTMSSTCDS